MKKLFTLIALVWTAWTVPAQAQINFGVKAGLNLTHFSINDSKLLAADNKTGFFAGVTTKITLPIVGLGLDGSLLYDQREAQEKTTGTTLKQQSIQIPVNVRYSVGLGSLANIFAYAGPQFGFNIGDKNESLSDQVGNWRFKSSALSGNVGVGVTLVKHLQGTVNYNFALGKTGDFEVSDLTSKTIKAKANAWQVSVAYFF